MIVKTIDQIIGESPYMERGVILARLAHPKIVKAGISESETEELSRIIYQKNKQLELDANAFLKKISKEFFDIINEKEPFRKTQLNNHTEKLQFLINKKFIGKFDPRTKKIKEILTHSKKHSHIIYQWDSYKFDVLGMVPANKGNRDPILVFKKIRKLAGSESYKIPKRNYQGFVKASEIAREAGEVVNRYNEMNYFNIAHGINRDFMGFSFMFSKPYDNSKKHWNENPINALLQYLLVSSIYEIIPDANGEKVNNRFLKENSTMDSINFKIKYNPIQRGISSQDLGHAVHDPFEIQFLDRNGMLDKELGDKSKNKDDPLTYKSRQEKDDSEFFSTIPKSLTDKVKDKLANPEKKWKIYRGMCETMLNSVLRKGYH